MNAGAAERERRWIVLSEDGRHVTLGRHSDPTDEDILKAEEALRAQGLTGWIAIMEGNPYVSDAPRLMEVRPLASPRTLFASAAEACLRRIKGERSFMD